MRPHRKLIGLAVASVMLPLIAACGAQPVSEQAAEPVPTTSAPAVTAPTESAPAVTAPTESAPAVTAPTESAPAVTTTTESAPVVTTTTAAAPVVTTTTAAAPVVTTTTAAAPVIVTPETSVPAASVPEVSVPSVSFPSVSLPVAAEVASVYDRDEWGPHNSDMCREASGSSDPYTETVIDTCNVDHVVALHEAHESGGWAWSGSEKQRFSQDPINHVASRACVNQSKGGDDIAEWSDAEIASSSACGGGYQVTAAGRCFLATTTVAVKSAWDLSVDQAEADALAATLTNCGDETPEFSAGSQEGTATTSPPTTTAPPRRVCDRRKDRDPVRRGVRYRRGALRQAGRRSAVRQPLGP